ncbi:MAG: hypothetical protein U0992_11230 [Planctomycetaceae bacterium]
MRSTRATAAYFGRGNHNFADPLLKDKAGQPQYNIKGRSRLDRSRLARIKFRGSRRHRHPVPGWPAVWCCVPVICSPPTRKRDLGRQRQSARRAAAHTEGRQYGFPPRHPVHLPDVIDETSTFDYALQASVRLRIQLQRSSCWCGLIFDPPGP